MFYNNKHISTLQSVDTTTGTAQMQLFGVIGQQIDGNRFAMDLLEVAGFGFSRVNININSVGGSILEGFSILNAMNTLRISGTAVATSGLGVMDSMAGIILAFGDRGHRSATDFSSGVIHEPLTVNDQGEEITLEALKDTDPLKKELLFMRESLLVSLSGSTGRPVAQLRTIMKQGTRRSARELKELGLIDTIITASNSIDTRNLSRIEAMAACSRILPKTSTNPKKNTMNTHDPKEALAQSGQAQGSDDPQNQNLKVILKDLYNKTTQLAQREAEIAQLKAQAKTMEAELAQTKLSATQTYVDQLIAQGKFSEDKKQTLLKHAQQNFESFKAICGSLSDHFVDVTKMLSATAGQGEDDTLLDLAKDYHKHDVQGTLETFKNKVGERRFNQVEEYYSNNLGKVAPDNY